MESRGVPLPLFSIESMSSKKNMLDPDMKYAANRMKSIKIDAELHSLLNKKGKRGETYSQIIRRLILAGERK